MTMHVPVWQASRLLKIRRRRTRISGKAATHENLGEALVFVGLCREAAKHHSPGLQPWVRRPMKSP